MTTLVDKIVSHLDKKEQRKLTKCDIDILKKFDGNTVLETEKIRQHFKGQLTDDQVLELLGVLMGYEILDIVGDKVFLTDKGKLNELIKEHQNMLKVNSVGENVKKNYFERTNIYFLSPDFLFLFRVLLILEQYKINWEVLDDRTCR